MSTIIYYSTRNLLGCEQKLYYVMSVLQKIK